MIPDHRFLSRKCPVIKSMNVRTLGVLGSVFFGWAGGRWSKQALLGVIYTARSLGLCVYFMLPPTPLTTLLFAAAMGFLWLGVGPLIAGSVERCSVCAGRPSSRASPS